MTSEYQERSDWRPSIVGLGLVAADVLVQAADSKVLRITAGGTCGNVLTILGAFGWRATPIARLGRDGAGEVIRSDMQQWGVDLSMLMDGSSTRSPVFVHWLLRDRLGLPDHRFSRQCPHCGSWLPSFHPVPARMIGTLKTELNSVDVLFVDRASRGAIDLARMCRAKDGLIVFEPSTVGDVSHFKEMMELAHIVKYSSERGKKFSELLDDAHLEGFVIETLGNAGLRYRVHHRDANRSRWKQLPSESVAIVRDTAGAGDWCTAGLLHSLVGRFPMRPNSLSEEKIVEGLRMGQEFAAWNCSFEGARGAMYDPNWVLGPRSGIHMSSYGSLRHLTNRNIPVCDHDVYCIKDPSQSSTMDKDFA